MNECRFSGARNAGDANEHIERNIDRDVLEIMLTSALDLDLAFRDRPALLRYFDLGISAKISSGKRRRLANKAFKIAFVNDIAAKLSRVRPDVKQIIGGTDRVFVVLDNQDRVADIPEVFENFYQPRVIARMQADARLIENIEGTDEQRTQICRKLNALSLAARQGRRQPSERQIIQADLNEKIQTPANFEQQLFRNFLSFL